MKKMAVALNKNLYHCQLHCIRHVFSISFCQPSKKCDVILKPCVLEISMNRGCFSGCMAAPSRFSWCDGIVDGVLLLVQC